MSRHWGSDRESTLRIARVIERSAVLGPGTRAVVVVQGCHLRCGGCIAEETHALDAGSEVEVASLCSRLAAIPDIAGVTFSGGEPFLQAPALARLIDMLRAERPTLSTMSYSGYRLEWLRNHGSPRQQDLLTRLDLLIDGPYVKRQHAPLRWRGSRNQRVHVLSPRHRADVSFSPDAPAGMEWVIDADLAFEWVGVPPIPDFLARLEAQASSGKDDGVPFDAREEVESR